jgi:hypothetical protein
MPLSPAHLQLIDLLVEALVRAALAADADDHAADDGPTPDANAREGSA